jgi:hypothetical protein
LLAVLIFSNAAIAQEKQLDQASFYSDVALTKLKRTSDSLNARFQALPHDKTYYSLPQALGNWISMDSLTDEARDFVKTKPSFEAFLRKFPFANVEKNLLTLRYQDAGYGNGQLVQFRSYPEKYPYEFNLPFDSTLFFSPLKKKWVDTLLLAHEYRKHDVYVACFFEKGFETKSLPKNYALKIEYADCINDTNTVLFPNRDASKSLTDAPIFLPNRKALYALIETTTEKVILIMK